MNKTSKVEVRMTPSEKAALQEQADLEGTSISTLVRDRSLGAPSAPAAPIDLEAEELRPLARWLDLEDSDGEIDHEQLADWKAFAADNNISLGQLLALVVVDANAKYLSW